jgi:hypothetical protein
MTNSTRIDDIASKLHTACSVIAQPTRDMNDKREEINELSAGLNNIGGSRLSVAAEIAAVAHAEAWTDAEIAQAVGKVGKMSNNNDSATKTLGVFVSEMKQFASPKVRADFPTTLGALQAAWLAEQDMLAGMEAEERKTADTPIKTFKPRIYHLVIECARRIKDGKLIAPTCIEDVIAWARANDPRNDEERVKKAIAASIAKLEEMLGNFGLAGLPDVKLATDFLKSLSAKDLLAARTKMLADAEEQAASDYAHTNNEVSGEQPAQPAVAGAGELITGAFDYTQDALNNYDQIAA